MISNCKVDDIANIDTVDMPCITTPLEDEFRFGTLEQVNEVIEKPVSRHVFLSGLILLKSIKNNPLTNECIDVYSLEKPSEIDIALDLVVENADLSTGTVDSHFGIIYDLKSIALPFSLFVQVPGLAEPGFYNRINLNKFNEKSFELDNGKTLTLKEIDDMHSNHKINATEYGLFYFFYLKYSDDLNETVFLRSLANGKNEFGIQNAQNFRGNENVNLNSILYALPHLVKNFMENSDIAPERLFFNPFKNTKYECRDFADGFASLSQVRGDSHGCHEVAKYSGKHFGAVFDGISLLPGVLPLVELLTRYADEGFLLNGPVLFRELSKLVNLGICKQTDFMNFIATMSGFYYNRNEKILTISTFADAVAMHFDRDFRLVQILGGESALYEQYAERDSTSIGRDDIIRYLKCNGVSTGIGMSINTDQMAESRAKVEPGDFVIVGSDGILCMLESDQYKLLEFCDKKYSPRFMNHQYLANRDMTHKIHAVAYDTFVKWIQRKKKLHKGFSFEELVVNLKERNFDIGDDLGMIVKRFD